MLEHEVFSLCCDLKQLTSVLKFMELNVLWAVYPNSPGINMVYTNKCGGVSTLTLFKYSASVNYTIILMVISHRTTICNTALNIFPLCTFLSTPCKDSMGIFFTHGIWDGGAVGKILFV